MSTLLSLCLSNFLFSIYSFNFRLFFGTITVFDLFCRFFFFFDSLTAAYSICSLWISLDSRIIFKSLNTQLICLLFWIANLRSTSDAPSSYYPPWSWCKSSTSSCNSSYSASISKLASSFDNLSSSTFTSSDFKDVCCSISFSSSSDWAKCNWFSSCIC